jgi:hypothetical protein
LVHLDLPEHLVLDLEEILRIEEIAASEQLVGDVLGTPVERALLAEPLALGGLGRSGHNLL